ncbi:hypothetical protein [Salinarimonas sp.]|uniref:hypothetical protein n=1 Tax=Salinarimonas sp. TaxID=2766526 RepID=UPI003919A6AF
MSRSTHVEEGALSKAQEYGFDRLPRLVGEPLTAVAMLRRVGLRPTAAHMRTIGLIRALDLLDDRRRRARFVASSPEAMHSQESDLRLCAAGEADAAVHCAPVPAATLVWSFEGLGLALERFHFVDVGSGWGYALRVAADLPFRHLTGIEFAKTFHDMAVANFAAFAARGEVAQERVSLLHESALESDLPREPLVVLLANPFGPAVMRPFVERLRESVRADPRPVEVVYVNPKHPDLFEAPDIRERNLDPRASRRVRALSPYGVRVYSFGT